MDFDTAFERLMMNEGGLIDDPADPGGRTKFGISQRSYPDLDIAALTRDDARTLYKRDFWDRIHADKLNGAVAFQVFDFAVNSGIETAVRKLQSALGVADDGYWGPLSQAAADTASPSGTIMRFVAQRLRYWTKLKNWPHDGAGWVNRAARDLEYGAIDS